MRMLSFALMLSSLIACGVERLEDERMSPEDIAQNSSAQSCRKSLKTGCLQGQIVAAPGLQFAGKDFVDAETFFKSAEESVLNKIGMDAKQAKVVWVDEVTNQSFIQGFQVFIKGTKASQSRSSRQGYFVENELPEGIYQLHAQKIFPLELMKDVAALSEVAETASETTVSQYCMLLSSASDVEIRANTRTIGVVLDQFEVELRSCDVRREELF